MTSCCSIANLTLESTAPGADGKRMWSVDGSRWMRWKGALADAGCSAGLEGQDGRARSPGNLNWFNMSVCGPRATRYVCSPGCHRGPDVRQRLAILNYYRSAITAGAMKKRAHDTTRGRTLSDEKTISNTSVVPAPVAEA